MAPPTGDLASTLATTALFVRALGALAGAAPESVRPRITAYTKKTADMLDAATVGTAAFVQAQQKMRNDSLTMQGWVQSGYEPTEADFDSLEGRIDELHERFQAQRKDPPPDSST